jgi:hypothetical protein
MWVSPFRVPGLIGDNLYSKSSAAEVRGERFIRTEHGYAPVGMVINRPMETRVDYVSACAAGLGLAWGRSSRMAAAFSGKQSREAWTAPRSSPGGMLSSSEVASSCS